MIWLFYLLQIIIIFSLITIIMLQKGGDGGLFSSSKAFGIRGRSNTIIRITYFLGAAFLLNSLVMGVLYKRKSQNDLINVKAEEMVQISDTEKLKNDKQQAKNA